MNLQVNFKSTDQCCDFSLKMHARKYLISIKNFLCFFVEYHFKVNKMVAGNKPQSIQYGKITPHLSKPAISNFLDVV